MEGVLSPTFLEDLSSVDLHNACVSVFILLAVTHDGARLAPQRQELQIKKARGGLLR